MEEPRPASSPLHSSSTSLAGWSGDCAWFPSSALRGHNSIRQFASEPASLPVTQWSTAPRVAGGSSSRLEFHTQQRAWSGSVLRWSQQQQRLKTRTSGRGRAHSSVHASLTRPLKKWLKKKKKKRCEAGSPAAPSGVSSGSELPNQTVNQVKGRRYRRNPAHKTPSFVLTATLRGALALRVRSFGVCWEHVSSARDKGALLSATRQRSVHAGHKCNVALYTSIIRMCAHSSLLLISRASLSI